MTGPPDVDVQAVRRDSGFGRFGRGRRVDPRTREAIPLPTIEAHHPELGAVVTTDTAAAARPLADLLGTSESFEIEVIDAETPEARPRRRDLVRVALAAWSGRPETGAGGAEALRTAGSLRRRPRTPSRR